MDPMTLALAIFLNGMDDQARFDLMDAQPQMFALFADHVEAHGYKLHEDGSIGVDRDDVSFIVAP